MCVCVCVCQCLEATEDTITNQLLIEYVGKVFLRGEQYNEGVLSGSRCDIIYFIFQLFINI